jgi:hypothetical protein
MDSFTLSRNWFNFSFENPELINPTHTAILFFAIEHCNRLGGKEKFGFPTQMTMDAIGIKKHHTYIKYFNDLVDWGFIKLIQKSTNQYSANIISLIYAMPEKGKALDKALAKHGAKQSHSMGQSNGQSKVSIDKQLNNETIKQDSPAKKPDTTPNIFLRDFQVTEQTDLPEKTMISFWKLFRENMAVFDLKQPSIENAKINAWLPPVKKLLSTYTKKDLLDVYWYLKDSPIVPDKFSWRKQIRSTSKLAEKFEVLLLDARVKSYVPPAKKTELKLRGINDW